MIKNDEYDDDYVAKLLAEDAKKSSANYAARGLSGLLPKRLMTNAPKPNTRFLSQLVREADNHNAALKKKEELEAKIRLREMQKSSSKKRERDRHEDRHDRKRHRHSKTEGTTSRHLRDQNGRRIKSPEVSYIPKQKPATEERDEQIRLLTDNNDHHTPQSKRKRPLDPADEKQSRKRAHSMSRSPVRKRAHERQTPESDSDPLAEIIGPRLDNTKYSSVPVRGRGAYKSRSNIDDHFAAGYDPSKDLQTNSESSDDREDWDQALEALRDRRMWKQKQSERLREAGWDDNQIKKWEEGSMNGLRRNEDLGSVRWAKQGERREWDNGKEESSTVLSSGGQEGSRQTARKNLNIENAWARKNNGFLKGFMEAIG